MTPESIQLPQKGFTKAERAWLAQLLEAIKTVQAVQGRNCTITNTDDGQIVNADDCTPCP